LRTLRLCVNRRYSTPSGSDGIYPEASWLDGSGRYRSPYCNEDLREARKGESTFMNWDIIRAYDIRGV